MKVCITLTTINKPTVVAEIAERYSGQHELSFVVAGDVNSLPETKKYLAEVADKFGRPIFFTTPDNLDFAPELVRTKKIIPTKSFAQRNYADYAAVSKGAEIIIRIDDDNFPLDVNSFVDGHASRIGVLDTSQVVSSTDGWFNCCDMLHEKNNVPFYPRGFPVKRRFAERSVRLCQVERRTVVVNAGLWTGDPDVDAHQRLSYPIFVEDFSDRLPNDVVLERDTWCPINTQNTSYAASLLPLMFVSPNAGRYDDIISGYLMRGVLDLCELSVSFGAPLVVQRRNLHNIVNDLKKEVPGLETSDLLTQKIREGMRFIGKGGDIAETYLELLMFLTSDKEIQRSAFLTGIINESQEWCKDISGRLS